MKKNQVSPAAMSRRCALRASLGLAAAAWLGHTAKAQPAGDAAASEPTSAQIDAALPLDTYGLEHIGTVVPDVTRAARFFSAVFNPALYKERAEPLRYYVTLDPGYIALGSRAGATRAFFDHDCALLRAYDRAAMARRLAKEGLPEGRVGVVPDPDGLGLQLLGAPGGLAASTEPAGRLVDGEPLVRPRGLAHVVHYVADLERSAAFYRKFFGAERRENGRVIFRAAHTSWILERAPDGEAPRIDRVGIHAARFDAAAVTRGLEKLGARVVAADAAHLHFRSPEGLGVELLPVDPARIWGLGATLGIGGNGASA
jgi:catechol 2,3-dioxygenase-like lactoylglutathione lyase family enzyme